MLSYGIIYMSCDLKTARSAASIALPFNNNMNPKEAIEKIYQEILQTYFRLTKKDPSETELSEISRKSMYVTAEEVYRTRTKKPKIISVGHLSEIKHSTFSINTVSETSKHISLAYPEIEICSVAGFDESAFQLCIFKNGKMVTIHQIGDELEDMGMTVETGEANVISSFFHASIESVSHFLYLDDVMDAEKYLFNQIVYHWM